MARRIVLPAIQQILEMKTGFRFAFHDQPALKEQCIGIFLAQGERREIGQRAANRDVRIERRGLQSGRSDLEGERGRHVVELQAEAAAGKLAQSLGERLPAQQMGDRQCDGVRRQRLWDSAQQRGKYGGRMQHEILLGTRTHCCHVAARGRLIQVKWRAQ